MTLDGALAGSIGRSIRDVRALDFAKERLRELFGGVNRRTMRTGDERQ
jgi:hypothetical protein